MVPAFFVALDCGRGQVQAGPLTLRTAVFAHLHSNGLHSLESTAIAPATGLAPAASGPASLAAFAAFLRDHHLAEYVQFQVDAAKAIHMPMMRFLDGLPAEMLTARAMEGAREFLTHLSEGRGDEYIQLSLSRWRRDDLGVVSRMQIEAADVTGINLLRKQALTHFLPLFTTDLRVALQIQLELDAFNHKNTTQAFELLSVFHREIAETRQEFIERVSAAVPGTLYVLDVQRAAAEYINDHLPTLLGYSAAEFSRLGLRTIASIIHPADRADVRQYFTSLADLRDGEVRSYKYRCIHRDGHALWVRSYDTPFRRAADGTLTQVVGFAFNITAEKLASEELKEREAQMLEAQAIARVGSYIQDLNTGVSRGTPELMRLLGLKNLSDWGEFTARVHPDDLNGMVQAFQAAIAGGPPYVYTFRYAKPSGGWMHISARGILEHDADGTPIAFRGTVQDVTEQQALLQELQEKERLYREAQRIARMGSWGYEIGASETYWSEQLLRIYGLDEQAGLRNRDDMRRYTLPEDLQLVSSVMDDALARGDDEFQLRYRIRTPQGELKYLHSRGTFIRDAAGKPVRVAGTVQDITEEQQMIERLAESKARYKEAQALAKVGSWTHDHLRGTRHWSDEMSRIFGVEPSPNPPGAQEFAKLLHPADRQRLLHRYRTMKDKPGTYTGEYRVGIGGESQQWIRMRTESIAGEDGSIVALRGTVQDITQEKAAEQRLLQQQTFTKKITDLAPSIITVFDSKNGRYEYVNEGLSVLLGYESEALLHGGPDFVLQRCHPDDLPTLQALAAKVLSAPVTTPDGAPAEAVHEGRYRLRNAEGEYRWLHTYATIFARDEAGEITKTLDISLDVTEQVQAEAAVRAQDHFVRNVTQLVPSIISVVDVETRKYVFMNETGASIIGQPLERIYEEGAALLAELAHPDDVPVFNASFDKALQAASTVKPGDAEPVTEVQFRLRATDGQYRWMRSLITPSLRTKGGEVEQLISITQDVTPLHEAEALLKKRAELLQQSNQSLEEFAYVASHDLQEPLRKISTFGEMLSRSDGLKGDERAASLLGKITESAKRMQTLINDLLDISVISRQKSFETAKLSVLLREVLQTLEHKIESSGAVVEADILPEAVVIPAQIRQL